MLGSVLPADKKGRINFWQKLFTEPVERIYLMMKDGTIFNHTNHYEDIVYMSIGRLEKTLKKFKNKNYSIKDTAIIIHNHIKDHDFSPEDRKQYRRLRKYGFNGLFLLYSRMTNKTYCLMEKEKSK
jgi:hypothetical protein